VQAESSQSLDVSYGRSSPDVFSTIYFASVWNTNSGYGFLSLVHG
jgi:hypothetical protein